METYTDQEIIEKIRSGGQSREAIATYLLKHWNGYAIKLSKKYHLSTEEQKDAYTDAIIKLISQIDQGQFRGESQLSSYFYSILNNICVDVLRKRTSNKNKPTEELLEYTLVEQKAFELFEQKDLSSKIRFVIESMGENCKNVLLDWGYYGYDMKEIAKRQKLSNAESARSIKYKCMKKLKALLASKNLKNE